MPSLTLQQTITMAMNQCGEKLGSAGASDPFDWQTLVQQSADEIAFYTDIYQANYTFDFVANQSSYSAPAGIYQTVSAKYTDQTLQPLALETLLDQEMDDKYPTWETWPASSPTKLVTRGLNSFLLWPAPSSSSLVFNYTDLIISGSSQYNVSSAAQRTFLSSDAGYVLLITGGTGFNTGRYNILTVSNGVATVDQPMGTTSSTGGIGEITTGGVVVQGFAYPSYSWTSLSQTNPMILAAHMATMWRAAQMRGVQFPKQQAARTAAIDREFKRAFSLVEISATKWTQATRRGVRRKYPFAGGFN